ncbi:MAG TPA: S16 family serine protease [Candidatus Norongarragalinales archaeon]|nr:S16 family serine protease [Candidatus Norongarragalinales archaeon]
MGNKAIAAFLLICAMAIAFNLGHSAFPSGKKLAFFAPAITDSGQGNLVEFEMQILPGEGRTLVNIQNADFKDDVEYALRKARFNADKFLGISSSKFDIVLSVRGEGSLVSGESAGGMFAVAIIALETGRGLRKDVMISALITERGELRDVGGIEEKILAAKEGKRNIFLVSSNQKIKDEDELGKGISIIRVGDLAEAAKYLIE